VHVVHAHVHILLVDDGRVKYVWEEVGGRVEVGGVGIGLICVIGIQGDIEEAFNVISRVAVCKGLVSHVANGHGLCDVLCLIQREGDVIGVGASHVGYLEFFDRRHGCHVHVLKHATIMNQYVRNRVIIIFPCGCIVTA